MQSLNAVGQTAVFATSGVNAPQSQGPNAGWQNLTDDDLKILSAMAGHEVKRDGLLPLAGMDILNARAQGETGPISASYFTGHLAAPGQTAEIRDQLERGLTYVNQRDAQQARQSSSYLDANAGRVNLYA